MFVKYKKNTLLILSALIVFVLSGCSYNTPVSKTDFIFDTVCTITLYHNSADTLLDNSIALCREFEKKFSKTIKESEIYAINNANGNWTTVSNDTLYLIKKGIYYGDLSDGKFDITINPLTTLWDFKDGTSHIPEKKQVNDMLAAVNYQFIEIDGNSIRLTHPDASIDLGGIAKGYIADKIKEYLVSEGVKSGLINLGGNVMTIGLKPDASSYRIGIRRPFSELSDIIATVSVKDKSVVSSGIYERYFYKNEILYHHILNPKTGFPYDNELLSVTIISPSSVDGDALSTTCLALGVEEGLKLIESLDDTEAVFITDDYLLTYTSGFPLQ